MTIHRLIIAAAAIMLSIGASAQNRLKVDYNLHFDWHLDNREFDSSDNSYAKSGTDAAARITPYGGILIEQPNGLKHNILMGIDLLKDLGNNPTRTGAEADDDLENWDIFREITLFYIAEKKTGNSDFSFVAGVYPRHMSKGKYTNLFYSDSVRFYDNNFDGVLLNLERPRSYYEIGMDWMGKYGTDRRERFMFFTYGESWIFPSKWLKAGWQGYLQHYANSANAIGVVDDIKFNPFIEIDFGHNLGLQRLSLTAGPVVSYQRDRRFEEHKTPHGWDFISEVRYREIGIRNELYYGENMMPYYKALSPEGSPYAGNLYLGDSMWQIRTNGDDHPAVYNRLEAYWRPKIGDFVHFDLSVIFHFNESYIGWQQKMGLIFDLNRAIRKSSNLVY